MQFVTIDDKKLAVEIEGSGEPVIMMHGLGGTTNVWGAQAKALAARFTSIRFDLEGSGRSPAVSSLSVQGWVQDLDALMRSLGIASARIVAHSLGTLIAQHFAAAHPERVSRLTLLGINRAPQDERRQALRDRAAKVRSEGLEAIVDNVVSAGTSQHARADNPLLEHFARELVLRQPAEGYARSCEAVAGSKTADISRIRCPVLLIAGDEDSVSPPKTSETVAPTLADAKLVVLEKCGHWMPIERPHEVTRALLAFL
jgi:pimeloyl-ACP methyl ester carboxylesterase